MPSRTKVQRCSECCGFTAGSQRDGDWINPASIAPSLGDRSCTFFPK
jgi:hypothetical protein